MKLEVVDYHSHVPSILRGGTVLDVGARGFHFAKHFALTGHRVIALDPDPEVCDPKTKGIEFHHVALVGGQSGLRDLVLHPNPEARYIAGTTERPQYSTTTVEALTLHELMARCNVADFDLVKLNCEGEEADLLRAWPGPVARQIVVSFHEHFRKIGDDAVEAVMKHMDQWYARVRHVKDARYGGGDNWWDTVLVRRDLVTS